MADELVDLDKLYTSDIYAILQTYGVEACRTAIINEMAAVFGVYGIKVDYRHRTVIADYMVSPRVPESSSPTTLHPLLPSLSDDRTPPEVGTDADPLSRPTRDLIEHSTELISATNHPLS